ncbi:MAG: UDP-N-acetylmuramoyl-L-alanine--D-glutamate ligase [Myxococcales bacterium]|nr:UDP-N-acetylmuramoyl-L-alanine--D-glutamate ligase [Myxococcales bacterium]
MRLTLRKREIAGRRILVWGLGRTGLAALRFLVDRGASVTVVETSDPSKHQETISAYQEAPVRFLWGDARPVWSEIDAVLLSPGVPFDLPALEEARAMGVETISEMEWGLGYLEAPWIGITGSAGKSTTTSLLGAMLEASDLRVFVGGNLGIPLVAFLNEAKPVDWVVLECSSFQLEASPDLHPNVGVLTNLKPNHLDRHGTMERYAACKAPLFRHLQPNDPLILRGGDDSILPVVQESMGQRIAFWNDGEHDEGAMCLGETMILRHSRWGEERYDLRKIKLRGAHNRENVMAAALAARCAGATFEGIQKALDSFGGLVHRQQELGEWHGVKYINDSKATTPDSALRAVQACSERGERLRLLLGGRSKGTGFASLYDAVQQHVEKLYLFGEAREEILGDLHGATETEMFASMEEALNAASRDAQTGEIVLLSPACTSFDAFRSFEHRGEEFARWFDALHLTGSAG